MQPVTRVLVNVTGLGLVERRVGTRDRWAARWHAAALDRRLAGGETAENDIVLAVHAQMLTHPATRHDLASTVLRILDRAHGARPGLTAVLVCGRAVRPAAPELRDIVERLLDHGPVTAYGIAQLRLLLTDGGGPLYQPHRTGELAARLREARAALDTLEPP